MASTALADARAGREPGSPSAAPAGAGRRALRTLLHDPVAVACLAWALAVVFIAVAAPLMVTITGAGPDTLNPNAINPNMGGEPLGYFGGISLAHPFGVEPTTGRDILARIAYGARSSFLIALGATFITVAVGTVTGLLAGYYRAWTDEAISRLMDFLLAFPALIFMIAILSALPNADRTLMLVAVLSLFGWPYLARVIRGQTMSVAARDFVAAAKVSGASTAQIVFREILPNLRGTIIVITTISIPGYILTEAGLSFLGIGINPPAPSWGDMIFDATNWYETDPMYFVIPGGFLFLTLLSLTVFGDRLRKALDAS
jgi:peptide/nickel transport system permease protein